MRNETWSICANCHQAYQEGKTHVCVTSTLTVGSTTVDPMQIDDDWDGNLLADGQHAYDAIKQRAEQAESERGEAVRLLGELYLVWLNEPVAAEDISEESISIAARVREFLNKKRT